MHKSAPYKERLQFKVATVEDECEKGAEKYDIVFSNSSLHWCLDHAKLFPDLVRNIVNPNGGVLAVQMPDTQQQRSHVLMDIAAFRSGQLDRLLDVRTNTYICIYTSTIISDFIHFAEFPLLQ